MNKPFKHKYTTTMFYIASTIYTQEGLTHSLREDIKYIEGSIENEDIIFFNGHEYIATYMVKRICFPKYTDLCFYTFSHKDLSYLKEFMVSEGYAHKDIEIAYSEQLKRSKEALDAIEAKEDKFGMAMIRSFLVGSIRNG